MTSKANKTPHLEIGDLHCSPPARPALRGISFYVSHGSFFAIAGANGSGKNTLCRCLARLYKESQGRIRLEGQELPDQPEDLPAMGMMIVLQGEKVFPEMSVLDNLLCSPATWRRSQRHERLDAVLHLLPHLKERFRQSGGTLSGGEQQMVAIGRALMAGPSLLVLEEPSFGLAAKTVTDLYAALTQICGEGRTVIVTEETLETAYRYADVACHIKQGRIANLGRPRDIYDIMRTRESLVFS
ncbi:MAG TPA: ATP-binding cassette domain-containing protein [Chthoniobacterales bacterium]|nr:ATP-binding cassette domain-containing protein [Chthoniobacterales bacterium]